MSCRPPSCPFQQREWCTPAKPSGHAGSRASRYRGPLSNSRKLWERLSRLVNLLRTIPDSRSMSVDHTKATAHFALLARNGCWPPPCDATARSGVSAGSLPWLRAVCLRSPCGTGHTFRNKQRNTNSVRRHALHGLVDKDIVPGERLTWSPWPLSPAQPLLRPPQNEHDAGQGRLLACRRRHWRLCNEPAGCP
jgi:hypothetical protein